MPIQILDNQFCTNRIEFGIGHGRQACVWDIGTQSVRVVSDPSGYSTDLKKVAEQVNSVIDGVQRGNPPLNDAEMVNLYHNCAKLDQKITLWNQKVEESRWVAIVDWICWIFTAFQYNYKQSLLVEPIKFDKLQISAEHSSGVLKKRINSLCSPMFKAAVARNFFKISRGVIRFQRCWRHYKVVKQERWNRSIAGRVVNAARAVGNFLAPVAMQVFRVAVRKAPEIAIKYAFRYAMIQLSIGMGLNPADVLLQQRMMELSSNRGRFVGQ
jgi:hypothetical protein